MSLQNLQTDFAELLFLDKESTRTDFLHPMKHLSVYHRNITMTLIKTLQEIYPMTVQLVGKGFFQTAAAKYIENYPSRSSNLHDYGEYFCDFLSAFPPAKHLSWLPDIATLEWHCHRLYFLAEYPPFDIQRLSSVSSEQYSQIHFILHPASYLFKSDYPVCRIMDLCRNKTDDIIELDKENVYLLMIRPELEIKFIPLSLAEWAFLTSLQQNMALADALDTTLSMDSSFQLENKLVDWIQSKTIVDYYLE